MKNSTLKAMRMFVFVVMCMLLVAGLAMAQTATTGGISGTVMDSKGAAIPNAKVTVTSTDTNASIDTVADGNGEYRISNLNPGSYSVSVEAASYASYKASVTVQVSRVTTLDPKLNVGAAKGETVEVTGTVQAVNTESQEAATNFGQDAINELPINGRRWTNYALLTPTSNPDGTFGLVSFRGISGLLNNFTVDGGDNNNNFYAEERGRTRLTYSTSQDSIQEFQINTSNYSSQYGRAAGGTVNAVTKSGSNKFHGSGYWYDRNNAIGAINPTTKLFGAPYKPTDVRYIYGLTIGGPVIKDKVFFFFNWDEFHRNFPGLAVPLTGNLNFQCQADGSCPNIGPTVAAPASCPAANTNGVNTLTGLTLGQGFFCRYGGNLALAQQAANDAYAFITDPTNGLLGTTPRRGDQRLFLPRMDVRVWGGNLSASYNWVSWNSPAGIQTQPSNALARDEFGNDIVRVDSLNLNYNKPLNATTAVEAKYHWSKEHLSGSWQTMLAGQPTNNGVVGPHPPGVSVQGWLAFGTQTYLPRDQNPDETQNQGTFNITKTIHRHTLKAGFEILSNAEFVSSLSNAYGTYGYTGNFSILNFANDAYNTATRKFTGSSTNFCNGNLGALLNVPVPCFNSFSQGIGALTYGFGTKDYAFYLQDDFRIRPRLMLNLGIRWEYESLPSPLFANPALPQSAKFPSDKNNFGPRIGFSYDVLGNGKFAVRGGYGLYYARIINSTISAAITNTGMPTAQPSYSLTSTTLVGAAPIQYPNILSSAGGLTLPAPNVAYFDPGVVNPYIHQADIIAEYEFMKDTVASVSYMISKGRKLQSYLDTNLPAIQGNSTFTTLDNGTTITVPTYGIAARPNTTFQTMTDIGNSVFSDYYALVAQVNKRMSKGLLFGANYTYSRARDNGQGSVTFSSFNNAFDPNNLALEYGPSNFDFPSKFTFNAVWQPELFKNKGDAAHWVGDGWTVSPIILFSSGADYTGGISGNLPGTDCLNTHSGGINCAFGNNRLPTIQRNNFRMHRRQNVDLRIGKTVTFRDKYAIEFTSEAFNLFNHPNVFGVNTTQYNVGVCTGTGAANNVSCTLTPNSSFAVANAISSSTDKPQRQIQFQLRFKF